MKNVLLLFFALLATSFAKEPSTLYLTYLHDPTSSITIQWHTDELADSSLFYRAEGEDDNAWKEASGSYQQPTNHPLCIHTVELNHLLPDTAYLFRFSPQSPAHLFRTLPKTLSRPVQFVVGGDAYYYFQLFHKMNVAISKKEPDFVVLGGDIAYTLGRSTFFRGKDWEVRRWQTFFKEWSDQMIASDGRIIPILPVVGNHDINKKAKAENRENLLFTFFAFPPNHITYRCLTFGDYLDLLLLDTNHYASITGSQKNWLRSSLKASSARYKFAAYHVAAYPGYYSFSSPVAEKIRTHWVPLFEEFQLSGAFEHHNHVYKRTYPLKEGKIDPSGIIYFGDGSWGTPPRTPRPPSQTPFIEKRASINAVWLVSLSSEGCKFLSFDNNGQTIEELSLQQQTEN